MNFLWRNIVRFFCQLGRETYYITFYWQASKWNFSPSSGVRIYIIPTTVWNTQVYCSFYVWKTKEPEELPSSFILIKYNIARYDNEKLFDVINIPPNYLFLLRRWKIEWAQNIAWTKKVTVISLLILMRSENVISMESLLNYKYSEKSRARSHRDAYKTGSIKLF